MTRCEKHDFSPSDGRTCIACWLEQMGYQPRWHHQPAPAVAMIAARHAGSEGYKNHLRGPRPRTFERSIMRTMSIYKPHLWFSQRRGWCCCQAMTYLGWGDSPREAFRDWVRVNEKSVRA